MKMGKRIMAMRVEKAEKNNLINTTMRISEINEVITAKNDLLVQQTRRIKLLEEKMTDLRRRYFELKYADVLLRLKGCL